ncbi:MAG: hypothetical protein WC373_06750, partial [Smithella sp.]
MGLEKIGLEAVFKTDGYVSGMKKYIAGNKEGEKSTGGLAEKMSSLVGDLGPLTGLIGGVAAGVKIASVAWEKMNAAVAPTVERSKDVR